MINPSRVLVVFYSRCGSTEKLALAAAVGAVQARANIRLRRLPDVADVTECNQETSRMRKEYVTPAEADLLWADAIIFLLPPDRGPSSGECGEYIDLLRRLKAEGKLEGKIGSSESPVRLENADDATTYGRKMGRLLK
ncbi:MAG TPA: NAD(P)H-dependent oxidoreductase [Terriglobia bacterium]|nr:NAD(P)H-dependent oxidoreductase [Terriglobia bacterium]